LAADPSSVVILIIVPVTVIASVLLVALLVPFEPVCANASDVSSAQQVRMASGFFICTSQLMFECMMITSF
jgi:hypothetical protein